MSIKWVLPWYEMVALELMLLIAISCAIVNAWAQRQVVGLLRDLVEALKEAEA